MARKSNYPKYLEMSGRLAKVEAELAIKICGDLLAHEKRRLAHSAELLASAAVTAGAILNLAAPSIFHTEVTMLARGFFERVVNSLYILVCEDEELTKLERFSLQHWGRGAESKFEAGGYRLEFERGIRPKPDSIPEIKKAIAEFTGPRGGERQTWSKRSLLQRIDFIAEHTEVNVQLLLIHYALVYADASHALHGSLYGTRFWLEDIDHADERSGERSKGTSMGADATVLMSCGSILAECLIELGRHTDIDEGVSEAKRVLDPLLREAFGALDLKTKPSDQPDAMRLIRLSEDRPQSDRRT